MTLLEEGLFSEFEDLLEDVTTDVYTTSMEDGDDDETVVHRLDANTLTLNELLTELERRGLQPRGFFADDAKILQIEFDEEHESYIESKRKERIEVRELEAKRAIQQRRKILMDTQIREERIEIQNDEHIEGWLHLVQHRAAPSHSRIEVNDVTARSLAKALWTDSNVLSLDVGNMNLSDLAGAYLCRALRNNRSIVKIELAGNRLGPETCKSLGESLCTNGVVQFVGLESNPLTGKMNDLSGIQAIASMLRQNHTLSHLCLWRCNIGPEGGRIISNALADNKGLTCFEIGYNGWENCQILSITTKLEHNKEKMRIRKEVDTRRKMEADKLLLAEMKIDDEKKKEKDSHKWIEDQMIKRSEKRHLEMERLAHEKAMEEERKRKEEEQRLADEKKAKETAKKKGKKGKKKGKKAK
mmetsp:Transcript_59229/g.87988  ORF Transcript_59229/g.87988 Transcript_59229/m.87988 type:complete len:414 (+) Transcript_59229:80-1321(+)